MFKKILYTTFLLSVIILTGSLTATPPYDSLSIQGQFSRAENQFLHSRLKPGLDDAANYLRNRRNVYFTHQKPGRYHITCATLKSTLPSKQHTQSEITKIEKLARHTLDTKRGYKGVMYGLFAFVHGVDAKGKEIHRHYKNPKALKKILTTQDKVFGKPGTKITHIHFVGRFGTQRALPRDANTFLKTLKKRQNNLKMKSIYEGMGPFTAHVTVGVLKSFQGGTTKAKPALSRRMIVKAYEKIYRSFTKWKRHQAKTKIKTFHLKTFQMSGMKSKPKRRFVKIKRI